MSQKNHYIDNACKFCCKYVTFSFINSDLSTSLLTRRECIDMSVNLSQEVATEGQ